MTVKIKIIHKIYRDEGSLENTEEAPADRYAGYRNKSLPSGKGSASRQEIELGFDRILVESIKFDKAYLCLIISLSYFQDTLLMIGK